MTLRDLVPEGSAPLSKLDVRRLVGLRGAAVRRMEGETGAQIIFSFVPEPKITLMGSETAIDTAVGRILEEINATRLMEERFPIEQVVTCFANGVTLIGSALVTLRPHPLH